MIHNGHYTLRGMLQNGILSDGDFTLDLIEQIFQESNFIPLIAVKKCNIGSQALLTWLFII